MAVEKLSIATIQVGQTITQVKTGEVFNVTEVDIEGKKVTITAAENGEGKSISKATLERWYQLKEGSGDVQESTANAAEEVADVTDTDASAHDAADAVEEPNADAVSEVGEDTKETPATKEASGDDSGDAKEVDAAVEGSGNGTDVSADGGVQKPVGRSGKGDKTASPITPSNAGKDKDKQKSDTAFKQENAVLMAVRQKIIDKVIEASASVEIKNTSTYTALKEKHNFAELTKGFKLFNVSVISKSLKPDQIAKLKIAPATFGWTIDADFTVFDESDIDFAVKIILQSRDYRMANPVTRKKKVTV